ncbi:hypothetical protein BB560_000292 [Smittium megazygosporum]|uniref:Mannosyltransferase n=1 Tax=Smittium megazygosporum TaxID=133381 RepID=A0A2T9ZKT5_9FUNG|nr:hypothetical protein BB560_000292 [Smittium megazygosporum]
MFSIPVFNIIAATGVQKFLGPSSSSLQKSKKSYLLRKYFVNLVLLAMFSTNLLFSFISAFNYPGAYALKSLHEIESQTLNASVHIDTYSAMTGVSRFGERRSDWEYSKTENLGLDEFSTYTYLLTNNPQAHTNQFQKIAEVYGYDSISKEGIYSTLRSLKKPHMISYQKFIFDSESNTFFNFIKLGPKIWLLKNRNLISNYTEPEFEKEKEKVLKIIPFFKY